MVYTSLSEFCKSRGCPAPAASETWAIRAENWAEDQGIVPYHEVRGRLLVQAAGQDWVGVELEIVPMGNRYELAEELYQVGGLFCSEDSSLFAPTNRAGTILLRPGSYWVGEELFGEYVDAGFEIITDYGDLGQVLRICEGAADIIRGKAWSHDTRCCGLHVHLSRNDAAQIDIARLVVFWNSQRNREFLNLFTRREPGVYCHPLNVEGKKPADPDVLAEYWGDRHDLVNLNNAHTIELRGFRGTCVKATLLACVQLAAATWAFARDKDVADTDMTWSYFLRWLRQQPASRADHIWQYLAKRRAGALPLSVCLALEASPA